MPKIAVTIINHHQIDAAKMQENNCIPIVVIVSNLQFDRIGFYPHRLHICLQGNPLMNNLDIYRLILSLLINLRGIRCP